MYVPGSEKGVRFQTNGPVFQSDNVSIIYQLKYDLNVLGGVYACEYTEPSGDRDLGV